MAKKTADKTKTADQTRYKITWAPRPPLVDAGRKSTVIAVGRAGKNATTAAIRESHGQVVRVQEKRPGSWFWW